MLFRSIEPPSLERNNTQILTYSAPLNTIHWSGITQTISNMIGREQESLQLENLYNSKKAEFIAVFGRRRVGKTYLIREFAKQKKEALFFYVTGMNDGSLKDQLANFNDALGDLLSISGAQLKPPSNWREAFALLTDNLKKSHHKKIIIFMDEFPWMATRNSKLLQALEYYWNQHWSQDSRIKLIICGSSSGWILKNIVNNRGGLYNRVTHTINLLPFNLNSTKKLLSQLKIKLNPKQITQIYAVLGGIPFYLTKLTPGLSAIQMIEELAFGTNSFLLREFDNLYATLFGDNGEHIALARVIASHKHGISKENVIKQLKLTSGGTTTKWLNELEQAGFILKFQSFNATRKSIYYKMIDEYSLFYFRWIEPIKKSLLTNGMRKGYWESLQTTPAWHTWSGYAFELICYKHIPQISKALGLSPSAVPYSWRYTPIKNSEEQGAEIDLLFDRQDDSMTLCEIKYTNKPFIITKEYAKNLINKKNTFAKQTRTKKQLFLALISANGMQHNLYSDDLIDNDVDLKALFVDE